MPAARGTVRRMLVRQKSGLVVLAFAPPDIVPGMDVVEQVQHNRNDDLLCRALARAAPNLAHSRHVLEQIVLRNAQRPFCQRRLSTAARALLNGPSLPASVAIT